VVGWRALDRTGSPATDDRAPRRCVAWHRSEPVLRRPWTDGLPLASVALCPCRGCAAGRRDRRRGRPHPHWEQETGDTAIGSRLDLGPDNWPQPDHRAAYDDLEHSGVPAAAVAPDAAAILAFLVDGSSRNRRACDDHRR
jgi:hypothetical protein